MINKTFAGILLMLVLGTAPAMAEAPIRYGIVLAGDYPGDHPTSAEAARGRSAS